MKPIIFNTEMVKAILDGRKTQFRKHTGNYIAEDGRYEGFRNKDVELVNGIIEIHTTLARKISSKYKVGDVLYVRETFYPLYNDEDSCVYKADYPLHWTAVDAVYGDIETDTETEKRTVWKPSIHMPKKYARIFLKVTNVRVERLQDISVRDIEKETGWRREIYSYSNKNKAFFKDYRDFWNSTAKDGYKWEDNPYVFVYEFERTHDV